MTPGVDPDTAETERDDPSLMHARLRLALDAAQMGLWDWDLLTGELVWDERSAAMYGTTLADSTGSISDVDARVHPDDLLHVQTALSGAIQRGGAVDVEFRVVWPDGTVRWLYGRGQALQDEQGTTVRVLGTNVDVTEQRLAAQERIADAQRMVGLVAVAQQLGQVTSEAEVLDVVSAHGVSALGAQGAALCLLCDDPGRVRVLTNSYFDDSVRAEVATLPAVSRFPAVHAAVTGTAWYLADREAVAEVFPEALPLYARGDTEGSAAVPLNARGRLLGALSVGFRVPHRWRRAERELIEALAALVAQALERVRAQQAEQDASEAVRRMSETLQRSLLTDPPPNDRAQIAVRYQPAAQEAQVGGDWYDAFGTPDGALTLVIGDVFGHDQDAAAGMAQVRNVLRGVAQIVGEPPAAVLSALERALAGLEVGTLATAVLCQLAEDQDGRTVRLRWSNAGHPPPVLVRPDGVVELLEREADVILGLQPGSTRADHEVVLPAGSTLLLYTDGLVERRDQTFDHGLQRLLGVAARLYELGVEELSDALLEELAAGSEDDVALLVLRVLG